MTQLLGLLVYRCPDPIKGTKNSSSASAVYSPTQLTPSVPVSSHQRAHSTTTRVSSATFFPQ
jgi:hypothetical protein